MGGTAADVPLSAGGASPAGLARLLRGNNAHENLSPWHFIDQQAVLALTPTASLSLAELSKEVLLHADKEAPSVQATEGHLLEPASATVPIFPGVLILTTYYLLLTTYYSLLTTHYSLLTTHYSLLTTYYSLLTTY